jgi:DNA topoisomerase-1
MFLSTLFTNNKYLKTFLKKDTMAKRKQKKTKEETVSENFFPVEESDVKYSIEKPTKFVDPKTLETIESVGTKKIKKVSKKRVSKPRKTAKTKILDFTPKKIALKKNGYELIITEKPQAAMKIASSLGKSVKRNIGNVPYYEVDRKGKNIVVACAVGHLFTLKQKSNKEFPVFDIFWVPNFLAKKTDFTKRYYDVISKLVKQAGSVTVATDYDVEGEVIGFNIVRFLCGQDDASRMKFSTLTDKELNKAYEEKSPSLNWGQAIAGETRHFLDWIYGINLSRALMNAIKSTGKFKLMSIGRVQGPALNLIVKKEKEIQRFKPEPYWQVFITVKNNIEIELKHNKDIFEKSELSKFENLVGLEVEAVTEKKSQILSPLPPFDLTTLQTEAYKFHGLNPSRTLQIAQSLYLNGLISYPRTSSQKLPDSIAYKDILKKVARNFNVEHLIKREKPVEGKKTDPAHPSIYPTGETPSLAGEDEKVYNLIAKRFLSLFCEDAIIDNKKIKVEANNLVFKTSGMAIRKKAWLEIYPVKMQEREIPDLNGKVKIIDSRIEEKETQPPKRYTPASIISELEKRNLGTKATRSSILETLYNRDYVREKSIEATPFGVSLINSLEKYSPIIIDEDLTKNFEEEMEKISELKSGFEEREKQVLEKAKKTITEISEQFLENENKIGKELVTANEELREIQREENTLIQCPECGKGSLIITYSKKNRRFFVACGSYPNCRKTYSLPPNGVIKKSGKTCESCNFPLLTRFSKGKRPWTFCFNVSCPVNIERMEKYKNKEERNISENL